MYFLNFSIYTILFSLLFRTLYVSYSIKRRKKSLGSWAPLSIFILGGEFRIVIYVNVVQKIIFVFCFACWFE